MRKSRLAPYILVSVLIHAGVFIGINLFLKLPVEELETVELIPVEIVVVREKSPVLERGLAPGNRIGPKKAFQTKSQGKMETATDRLPDEMTRPIPKANHSDLLEVKMPAVLVDITSKPMPTDFQNSKRLAPLLTASRPITQSGFEPPAIAATSSSEPHMDVAMDPTLRNVRWVPQAETVAGKPIIPVSRVSSSDASAADPSPSSKSSLLDVWVPAVPIEAKAPTTPAYSQPPKKIETPMESRRLHEDLAAEFPPIPAGGAYDPLLMVSTLKVQSQPNGAQVYVNGLLVGETPLAWELPVGKHEVRLALQDYYDWKAQIELTEEHKALPVFFRLLPVNGTKE